MYFDQKRFPKPELKYVCWIDIMGASHMMHRSLITVATFISKLHVAALSNQPNDMTLYPMMDGIYIVIGNKIALDEFLKKVFKELADDFIATTDPFYRFIVKASVAVGPVIQGNGKDKLTDSYKKSLLFGIPMVQAFKDEIKSPPFGVFIHQSARAFSLTNEASNNGTPYTTRWWMWYNKYYEKYHELYEKINDYFNWHTKRSYAVEYSEEKIKLHRELTKQYFEYFD